MGAPDIVAKAAARCARVRGIRWLELDRLRFEDHEKALTAAEFAGMGLTQRREYEQAKGAFEYLDRTLGA